MDRNVRSEVSTERWDRWLQRKLADPDSCVCQLMNQGLSLDAAVITTMLARVYDQLLDVEQAVVSQPRPEDGDDWKT